VVRDAVGRWLGASLRSAGSIHRLGGLCILGGGSCRGRGSRGRRLGGCARVRSQGLCRHSSCLRRVRTGDGGSGGGGSLVGRGGGGAGHGRNVWGVSCAVLLEGADGSDGGRSPTGRARLSSRVRWSGEAQVNALMAVLEERGAVVNGVVQGMASVRCGRWMSGVWAAETIQMRRLSWIRTERV